MALTSEEARKSRVGTATLTGPLGTVKVHGVIGVLEYFGFQVANKDDDLLLTGISKDRVRKAHKRSRWLGDIVKQTVKESTARYARYASRRGSALPGEPIEVEALLTGERWTMQLEGEIGVFIELYDKMAGMKPIKLWGKTGNKYDGVILGTAERQRRLAAQPAPQAAPSGPKP